jgi:hypothetical protein
MVTRITHMITLCRLNMEGPEWGVARGHPRFKYRHPNTLPRIIRPLIYLDHQSLHRLTTHTGWLVRVTLRRNPSSSNSRHTSHLVRNNHCSCMDTTIWTTMKMRMDITDLQATAASRHRRRVVIHRRRAGIDEVQGRLDMYAIFWGSTQRLQRIKCRSCRNGRGAREYCKIVISSETGMYYQQCIKDMSSLRCCEQQEMPGFI